MEKMKVEVEVSKESFELAQALGKIAKVVIASQKDGFQPEDLTLLIAEAFKQFQGEGFKDLSKLSDEIKADPVNFGMSLAIALKQELLA